ncbi:MAG: mandelate racemase/muconate lactonizing enzyme family protein [Geminicoccaceae bacterium]|nr:mandelate racemase/muconate lactonizing enzyme family protein [Geminicoccaceae bacterium]
MKITDIETWCIQVGGRPSEGAVQTDFGGARNWLFVRVETDEGVYGVGEGSGWPRVIETAVLDLKHALVGEDPAHIDRLWNRMLLAFQGHGQVGTVGGGAMTAIEMALWDIKGKVLGQPVWNLLGGAFRKRIPVYGHAKTPEQARALMARGYRAFKVSSTGAPDVDRVAAVREAVGPERDVMVDAHGPSWMTVKDAIILGRALEPLDLLFYEDPIAPENIDGYARIRDALDIPLAAGERVSTIWGMRPLIERELVDVIQPDTGRAGGVTQMRKMAAMAEAHYISMAPHSGSLGPLAEFAALHVMATIPNGLMLERIEFDWPGRYEVVTPVLEVVDGHIALPTAPGLGVDIVEEALERYPSSRNVRDVPADDGWAFEPGTADENLYFQTRLRRRHKLHRRS